MESEIACSDYPYSFSNAKFLFQKVNRFLKEERVFLSTLYCFLGDQKPLEKQAFVLKSIKNAYYFKSRKNYDKVLLHISTKFLHFETGGTTNYDSY